MSSEQDFTTMSEASDLPIQYIPIDDLESDPLNQEAFAMDNLEALSDSIENNGFFGTIVGYPIGNGKYRIESGHRRYEAAILAGLDELPVHITTAPKDEIERRMRLTKWNLHNRSSSPMNMARAAKFLHETYELENERRKSIGLRPTPINEKIAADLECSISNIVKYKSLMNLIPQLQELADSGNYSWAILSQASALTENQQKTLYDRILGASRLRGPESVTGAWIQNEISEYKKYMNTSENSGSSYSFNRNDLSYIPKSLKDDLFYAPARTRRKDGAKKVAKALEFLEEAAEPDVLIKKSDRKQVLNDLKKAQTVIANLMYTIEHTK